MNNNGEYRIQHSLQVIKEYSGDNPVVSFSGGKDSLVAIDLAIKCGIDKVVFSDTTIELEGTLKYIKTVEDYYGIKIDVTRPPRDFFDLTKVFGFPSRRYRWCCEVVKFGPLGKYGLENKVTSFITGLRREESTRRQKYKHKSMNPLIPVPQVNPILDWTMEDVWSYIYESSLPYNPLYDSGFDRIGCWPCPYKTKQDWNIVHDYSPESTHFLQKHILDIYGQYEGLGINDVKDFVKNFKWTGYVYPQVIEVSGYIENGGDEIRLHLKNMGDVNRILKLLPIISRDFQVEGRTISFGFNDSRLAKILIEKALNCAGCGACIPTCKKLALNVDQGCISVDEDKCIMCHNCLNNYAIRNKCIGRNYNLIKKQLKEVNGEKMDLTSDIGLVRTKASLESLKNYSAKLGNTTVREDTFLIKNHSFNAKIRNDKNIREIEVFSKNGSNLTDNLFKIRKFILEAKT